MSPLLLLLTSRKFWVGTLTLAAVAAAVVLVAIGKLPESALLPTIGAITSVGLGVIGSIAWEDVASKRVPVALATLETTEEPSPPTKREGGAS